MAISITINGKTLQAEPGMSVLEAAQANSVYIPTLCYSPKLSPAGACRMCVVEIENMRGLPTACTVPVSKGMVIHTETETVQNLRREILSLILSEHPYTCLVCQSDCADFQGTVRKAAVTTGCQYCPANGQCELQELVDYLDLREMLYPISYRGLPVEHDDPFFDRDYNLCILCGRCVRTCQEVRHAGVLALINRGSDAIVSTAFGRSHLEMDCQFCGACVDVCPTGTLSDKRGKWEGPPTDIIPSVCPYCSVGCAVNMQVKDNKLIRAVGREDGPANDGQLCVRGRFGMVDVVHSLTRLQTPMVRRNGRLVRAAWDEALDAIAQNLNPYRQTPPWDRDDTFALVVSATATNEETFALQKFARAVMGSNNVAPAAGFPDHNSADELVNTLKTIDGPAIRDVREASCILVIGANPLQSHPVLGLEIRHALSKGARLITIDARQTHTTKKSDLWLQPNIATDHVLLSGMIEALVDERMVSKVPRPVDHIQIDTDKVVAITGVEEESIVTAARWLAETSIPTDGNGHTPGTAVIIYGSGVTHYSTAMEAIRAIRSLASLLDNAGAISVPGEGNFVGCHDMGAHPALLPGYAPISEPEARARFEAAWDTNLNPNPGLSYESTLDGIRTGRIKALYLAGEMPPIPELSDLEFLVVQDIVNTEVMQHAHVVLPTTTFAEMDGTLINLEGRVQRVHKAIPAMGLSRPGWMIASDLARHMIRAPWDYQSAAQVMAEIGELVPAYTEVGQDTEGLGGVHRHFESPSESQELSFKLDGIPQFSNKEYPLTLITERNLFYYRGACLTEQVQGMNLVKREEILHLSLTDAKGLGISDGDLVRVTSRFGDTECIVKVVDQLLPEGVAFASFNRSNGSPSFPSLSPNSKAHAIRIERESTDKV
jgi:predicted molibdopterin-dependent oxidoreductase YjgC